MGKDNWDLKTGATSALSRQLKRSVRDLADERSYRYPADRCDYRVRFFHWFDG